MEEKRELGHYRVDAELSHSSVCTVYRAYDKEGKRPVLLKKLHPQMVKEEDIRLRFEREAKVCARVKHPNIVDIYGIDSSPDLTMLAFEFIEGHSLADVINQHGHLEWRVALAMLIGLLDGLAFAHSKGVIHRDIKPDNILISNQGQVKIADFGLAIVKDAPKVTRQGMLVGTPAYLPPEGITGGDLDEQSDLFSLGVTFYETLTGVSPYQGQNVSEILQKILNYEPEPPSGIIPDIPVEIDRIIMRMLDKQPQLRPLSAAQTLADVRYLAEGPLPGQDLIHQFLKESIQFEPDESKAKIAAPPKAAKYSRKRTLWGVSVLIVLIVIFYKLLMNIELPPEPVAEVPATVNFDSLAIAPEIVDTISVIDTTLLDDRDIDQVQDEPEPSQPDDEKTTDSMTDENLTAIDPPVVADTVQTEADPVIIPEPKPTEPGTLELTCKPWAIVSVGNTSFGELQFPRSVIIDMEPGQYQIVCDNSNFPAPVVETVTIPSGGNVDLEVNLYDYFGVIEKIVTPSPSMWAEIWIDGKSYSWAPLNKRIILPFGKHTVELKNNPDYKIWMREVVLTEGDLPLIITATLEPKD